MATIITTRKRSNENDDDKTTQWIEMLPKQPKIDNTPEIVDKKYMQCIEMYPNRMIENTPEIVDKVRLDAIRHSNHMILSSLTSEQQKFVFHVLEKLKENDGPFYYFLSGSAGTGKSYTVTAIMDLVSNIYKDPLGLSTVLVTSPSEKAASLIQGKPLRQSLAIPLSLSSKEIPKLSAHTAEYLHSKLKAVKLIIIDDVSSMGKNTLSHVDVRLKQIFSRSSDFASIPIILAGDLRQGSLNFLSTILHDTQIWHKFQFHEFQSSFRHIDPDLEKTLNNFRADELSDEDVKVLNSRSSEDFKFMKFINPSSIFLSCDDKSVDCYNSFLLDKIRGDTAISEAVDVISGPGKKDDIAMLQEFYKLKPLSKVQELPLELRFKTSARYMITHDIDASVGLVAGAIGVLRSFRHKRLTVETIDLEFALRNSGNKKPTVQKKVFRIKRIDVTLRENYMHNLTLTRSQFPVIPAEALQLHNSQGKTLISICISLNEKKMTPNDIYTALSRVRVLDNLYLFGTLTKKHAFMDPTLHEELSRLRKEAPLRLPSFYTSDPEYFSVYYHSIAELKDINFGKNTSTIDSKLECIRCDPSLIEHDILIFAGGYYKIDVVNGFAQAFELHGFSLLNSTGKIDMAPFLIFSKIPVHITMKRTRKKKNISLVLLRVGRVMILVGFSTKKGSTVVEKRRYIKELHDKIPKHYKIIIISNLKFNFNKYDSNFQQVLRTTELNFPTPSVYHVNTIYTNFKVHSAQTHFSPFTFLPPVYITALRNWTNPVNSTQAKILNQTSLSRKNPQILCTNTPAVAKNVTQTLTLNLNSKYWKRKELGVPSTYTPAAAKNVTQTETLNLNSQSGKELGVPSTLKYSLERSAVAKNIASILTSRKSSPDSSKNKRKSCHIVREDYSFYLPRDLMKETVDLEEFPGITEKMSKEHDGLSEENKEIRTQSNQDRMPVDTDKSEVPRDKVDELSKAVEQSIKNAENSGKVSDILHKESIEPKEGTETEDKETEQLIEAPETVKDASAMLIEEKLEIRKEGTETDSKESEQLIEAPGTAKNATDMLIEEELQKRKEGTGTAD